MRRKTNRLVRAVLALALILALLPVSAHAAGYSDVPEDFWGTEAIEALSDGGLLKGYGDGRFGPNDQLSVAQLATVITRICGGREYAKDGDYAYGALLYCRDALNCLPDLGDVKPGAYKDACSREMAVYMLVSGLADTYDFSENSDFDPAVIPDFDSVSEEYREQVAVSYQSGVIVGVDDCGTFAPKLTLTRAQLAVVLYRLGIYDIAPVNGLGIALRDQAEYTDEELLDLFLLITPESGDGFIEAPATDSEFRSNILWLSYNGGVLLKTRYPAGMTKEVLLDYMESGALAAQYYPELGFRNVGTSASLISNKPTVVYYCLSADSDAEFLAHRAETLRAALALRQRLYDSGKLNESMTEKEKGEVLYYALMDVCAYDTTVKLDAAGSRSPSHTPYGALCLGKAVCDGYTGAYNLLLRLEGIECFGAYNDSHGWTGVWFDGELCYVDVTWGDTYLEMSDKFFAMTPEYSEWIHSY